MLQISVNEAVVSAHLPLPIGQHYFHSDLNLAISVQRQMLPRNTKQFTTIRYAGISVAARGIGGDYYDFLDLSPDTLGFLLAYVSGKGVAAALLMANLQASIRCECAHACSDPRAMLERVNAQFFESTLPEPLLWLSYREPVPLYEPRT